MHWANTLYINYYNRVNEKELKSDCKVEEEKMALEIFIQKKLD